MTRSVDRLVGVYHADGSLRGELSYWVGARLGRAHCALCDITHGTFRMKAQWRECRQRLPVEFETVHLDERPADLVGLTDGRTPCVTALVDGHWVMLLEPDDLEACHGDGDALVDAITVALASRGLGPPSVPRYS
jgi:hypothetical protein